MRDLSFSVAPALAERGRCAEVSGHSVIYVGWGERARAVISLDDTPVPEARAMIEALRARGLRVAVLTGDLARGGASGRGRLGDRGCARRTDPGRQAGRARPASPIP